MNYSRQKNSFYVALLCCSTFLGSQNVSAENIFTREKERIKKLLAPKEGEKSSEESVKELFSKADDNYSLLEKGEFVASLDAEYSYFESTQQTSLLLNGRFTVLDITADSERVISTTISADWGITDNLNLGIALPIYTKDNEQLDLTATDLGDVQLSIRWQPRPSVSGQATSLFYAAASFPTGVSPYEITPGEDLSTGQGHASFTIGSTVSKIFDPLVGFGSFGYTHNVDVDGLDQLLTFYLGEEAQPGVLKEIETGNSISVGLGLSYAITYEFTLTLQYQHAITTRSTFVWEYASEEGLLEERTKSATFDSGVAKLTAGWQRGQDDYFNLHFVLPVTKGQPDIIIGITMPIYN